MITKEIFLKFIDAAEKYDSEIERWSDFGINIFEQAIIDYGWELYNLFLETNFTEEGIDWVNWYMFERVSIVTGELLSCYDENGSEFYVYNSEQLWDLVKEYTFNYEASASQS